MNNTNNILKYFRVTLTEAYLSLGDQLTGIVLGNNSFQSLMNYWWQNPLVVVLPKSSVYCWQLVRQGTS